MALINLILEAIATHPEDTFTVPDIMKQLPKDAKPHTVRVSISRDVKAAGIVESSGKRVSHCVVYNILKRDVTSLNTRSYVKKVPAAKDNGLTLEQVGMAMIRNIENMKETIKELGQAYSDLQREYNKEVSASRLAVKTWAKKDTELRGQIKVLHDNLKAKEKTFNVRELTGQ